MPTPPVILLVDWTPYWLRLARAHYPAQLEAADAVLALLDAAVAYGEADPCARVVPVALGALAHGTLPPGTTRVVLAGLFGNLCVDAVARRLGAQHPALHVAFWSEAIVWASDVESACRGRSHISTEAVYAGCGVRTDAAGEGPTFDLVPTPAAARALTVRAAPERARWGIRATPRRRSSTAGVHPSGPPDPLA